MQLDEDFHEERLDEINELLGKNFSKVYRMVNWIEWRNEHGDDSDGSPTLGVEIADNTGRKKLSMDAGLERRRGEAILEKAESDQIAAHVAGIEGQLTIWLK